MNRKLTTKTGIARIWAAVFYSLNGLRLAISNEAAFRQEASIVVVLLVVLLFLPLSLFWKGLLFFATTSVLVVELLNSAIESVVDIASPEYHGLAKRAKDLGSAAVLVSIVFAIVLWAGAIFTILQGKPK
ncbi:MAG: diacylglycerol kinase [Ignavibacteriaceae bacterium]|jgi:diacylglycerol kinase (ATP)|nr:diacylglycerol kinase [Ignavibacteriaceae bacterium]